MNGPPRLILRRSAAGGLLLLLILVAAAAVVVPASTAHRNLDRSIEALYFQHEKLSRVAALETSLRARLAALKKRREQANDLLVGDSEALVGAELQEASKRIIRRAGGILVSTQLLQSGDDDPRFKRITVRVQMTAPIGALQRVLHAIESHRPLLFVDYFEIKARKDRGAKVSSSAPQLLKVTFNIVGYQRNEAI